MWISWWSLPQYGKTKIEKISLSKNGRAFYSLTFRQINYRFIYWFIFYINETRIKSVWRCLLKKNE
jgi:hypothetical protein